MQAGGEVLGFRGGRELAQRLSAQGRDPAVAGDSGGLGARGGKLGVQGQGF